MCRIINLFITLTHPHIFRRPWVLMRQPAFSDRRPSVPWTQPWSPPTHSLCQRLMVTGHQNKREERQSKQNLRHRPARWQEENAEHECNLRESIKRKKMWKLSCFIEYIQIIFCLSHLCYFKYFLLKIWTEHFIICLHLSNRTLTFRKLQLTTENESTWEEPFV